MKSKAMHSRGNCLQTKERIQNYRSEPFACSYNENSWLDFRALLDHESIVCGALPEKLDNGLLNLTSPSCSEDQ